MDKEQVLAKLKAEVGPFKAWLATNPVKFLVATFALGAVADRIFHAFFF
jgi:hypothetical protein